MKVLELGTKTFQNLKNINLNFCSNFNLVFSDDTSVCKELYGLCNSLIQPMPVKSNLNSQAYIRYQIIDPTSKELRSIENEKNFSNLSSIYLDVKREKLVDVKAQSIIHHTLQKYYGNDGKLLDALFRLVSLNGNNVMDSNQVEKITENFKYSIDENTLEQSISKLTDFRHVTFQENPQGVYFQDYLHFEQLLEKEKSITIRLDKLNEELQEFDTNSLTFKEIKRLNSSSQIDQASYAYVGLKCVISRYQELQQSILDIEKSIKLKQENIISVGDFSVLEQSQSLDSCVDQLNNYLDRINEILPKRQKNAALIPYIENWQQILMALEKTSNLEFLENKLEKQKDEFQQASSKVLKVKKLRNWSLTFSVFIFPIILYLYFLKQQAFWHRKMIYHQDQINAVQNNIDEINDILLMQDDLFTQLKLKSIDEFQELIREERVKQLHTEKELLLEFENLHTEKETIKQLLKQCEFFYDESSLQDVEYLTKFKILLEKYKEKKEEIIQLKEHKESLVRTCEHIVGESSLNEMKKLLNQLHGDLEKVNQIPNEDNPSQYKKKIAATQAKVESLEKDLLQQQETSTQLRSEVALQKGLLEELIKEKKRVEKRLSYFQQQRNAIDMTLDVLQAMQNQHGNQKIPLYVQNSIFQKLKRYQKESINETSIWQPYAVFLTLQELLCKQTERIPFITILPFDKPLAELQQLLYDLVLLSEFAQVIVILKGKTIAPALIDWLKGHFGQTWQEKETFYQTFTLLSAEKKV